jgi:methylmalonyl-CoA mutase cobalamin-binding subunit
MPFSAIICASQSTSDSPGLLRANLHFAGLTLLEYQVRQAAEAGAAQVMVLVGAVTQPLSRAIDRLTADGISVSIVRDMVSLLRDAPRDQDMLVVADGVIVPQRYYTAMAGYENAALLSVEDGAATANFERLDGGERWAGLARVTPDILFGTLDMIGDWDLELTLVRAAVQGNAKRIPVAPDDVLEARLALVKRQAEADVVAQALLTGRPDTPGDMGDAGAERYVFGPLAARLAPALLRSQVPAGQIRLGAAVVGAIGVVAVLLDWPVFGMLLFIGAILLSLTAGRLVRLARRDRVEGWGSILPQALVLLGIALIGSEVGKGLDGLYLAGLVAILLIGLARGRFGRVRSWAMLTPGSAVLLLLATTIGGYLAFGLKLAVLCAILSLGVAVIGPETKEN